MKTIKRFSILSILIVLIANNTIAQGDSGTSIDLLDNTYLNWYNLDYKTDKVIGVSVNKAYNELLVNKTPKKKMIVAVIDAGVDIHHEDLQGKIWVNKNEIPENGIDDDHNGYIDDINGWNFIGSISGKNIIYENYEYVRIVAKYQSVFDSIETEAGVDVKDLESFKLYSTCKAQYDLEYQGYIYTKEGTENFKQSIDSIINVLEPYTKTLSPTFDQIEAIKTKNKAHASSKKYLHRLYKSGFTVESLDDYLEYIDENLNFYLNVDLKAREIIGDDVDDFDDAFYGNNDVMGPTSEHGCFVAGIIAANRNNNIGIDGIADSVEIMVLRTVPDGDEDDKDVALSIKYAVDNGANIINMSFGKDHSPNKYMVDQAIRYAEEKGVLMVHAAGNESYNNDAITHYPDRLLDDENGVENWIAVGASSKSNDKYLAGSFSNYGKTTVELFAPGVDVISLYPESKYHLASGTSFSSPVVSGVAALVWSYYPELSVAELKDVLLESATVYDRKVILPSDGMQKDQKVKFSTLSITGGIANAYKALQLAEIKVNEKN